MNVCAQRMFVDACMCENILRACVRTCALCEDVRAHKFLYEGAQLCPHVRVGVCTNVGGHVSVCMKICVGMCVEGWNSERIHV